jgi:hypothetical protein
MSINCHKIINYNDKDPRYNFHIEDSTKYNKNNKVYVYNNIEDTIYWKPKNFKPKNINPNILYDQSRIKKDFIEHFSTYESYNLDILVVVILIIFLIICLWN